MKPLFNKFSEFPDLTNNYFIFIEFEFLFYSVAGCLLVVPEIYRPE